MPPVSPLIPLIGHGVRAANMLLEWLMTYAIHSTLLIGALLLVTATAAGRTLASAHGSWLWRFALVGAVISASLQSLRSASPLAGTVRLDGNTPARTMVRMDVTRNEIVDRVSTGGPRTLANTSPNGAHTVTTTSIDIKPIWPLIVLGTWLLGAVALAATFFIARWRFLRSIGPRRVADNTISGISLRHLQRESAFRPHVRLTVSDRLTSPIALDGREICLPARALSDLNPIRLESILAHELAHIVRRDTAWLRLARLIEAILFFQPLNRIARRRMQDAAEFASDAWASTRVARPLDLAHCLARVAEWTVASPRLPVPAVSERRGPILVRRVERLISGKVIPEVAPGRRARLGAVAVLLALVFVAPRGAVGAKRVAPPGVFNQVVPAQERMIIMRGSAVGTTAGREADVVVLRLGRE